jgi:hypothetical protein
MGARTSFYKCSPDRFQDTKQTRIVKKSVPTESFFNFFSPPQAPENDDDDDAASDIEDRLELDYQLGEDIKEKLIPRAIDWFTGEALQYEEIDADELEEVSAESDDDQDDMSSDGEEAESDDDDVSTSVFGGRLMVLVLTRPRTKVGSPTRRQPSASKADGREKLASPRDDQAAPPADSGRRKQQIQLGMEGGGREHIVSVDA